MRNRRHVLIRTACGFAVVATVVALSSVGGAVARAANPKRTVTLSGGLSAYGIPYSVVGIAGGDVIFVGPKGLEDRPVGGGAVKVLNSLRNGYSTFTTSGDLVAWQGTDRKNRLIQEWVNVATNAHGQASQLWLAAAPGGGVYVHETKHGSVHLEYQLVSDPANPTDLGTLDLPDQYSISALANSDGVELDEHGNYSTSGIADYVQFANPGVVTHLDMSGLSSSERANFSCTSITSTQVGCATKKHIVRLSLAPNTAPQLLANNSDLDSVEITNGVTSWTTGYDFAVVGSAEVISQTWHSEPAAGGKIRTFAHPVEGVVSDGSSFYLSYLTERSRGGIYATDSAGSAPQPVLDARYQPDEASAIGLGPGRVAWRDDSTTSRPMWSRSLTTEHGKVVAGAKQLTTDTSSGDSLSVSGDLTAYQPYAGSHKPRIDLVTRGRPKLSIRNAANPELSGNRLLYTAGYGGSDMLRDLRTGKTINLTKELKPLAVALWGDYIAYVEKDGSVWRKPVGGGRAVKLRPALPKSDVVSPYSSVTEWGDWLAWDIIYSHHEKFADDVGVRNAKTLAKARQLKGYELIGSSAAGVELERDIGQYSVQPWRGGKHTHLPRVGHGGNGSLGRLLPPVLDGTEVAWVGVDQRAHVAPISSAHDNQPRSLGDPHAPRIAKRGHVWMFALPTSAVLSHCRVTIKRGHHTVAALGCSKTKARVGVAAAEWHVSRHAARGAYTWTVSGSNADGKLLTARGTTGTTQGSITVK